MLVVKIKRKEVENAYGLHYLVIILHIIYIISTYLANCR